jgi:hypothetical protein
MALFVRSYGSAALAGGAPEEAAARSGMSGRHLRADAKRSIAAARKEAFAGARTPRAKPRQRALAEAADAYKRGLDDRWTCEIHPPGGSL